MASKRPTKRKDGRYEKAVTINGKVHHFYGKTQREVLEKMMAFQEKEEKGILFGELADEYYWDYIEEHPSSKRAIKAHVERLAEWFGEEPAKDITAKQLTEFLATLDGLSMKTVTRCKSFASGIFDYGIREHGLENNPANARKVPKHLARNVRKPPSDVEIRKIKERTDAPYALFFLIRLYTGLRRGEILALQYRDIDFEKDLITVSKSVYHEQNQPVIKEPKTEKGKRQVILLNELKEILPRGKADDFIFGGKKPWTAHETQRHLAAYQRATGLKVSPHQLRHAYRTILYEAGIDERMRMDLLGHRNIRTTRDIYTHISNRRREEAAAALNAFFVNSSSKG